LVVTTLLAALGFVVAPPNVGVAQAVPSNDAFPGPMLTGYGVSAAGDNTGATKEQGEPEGSNPDQIQHSVWYSWTAPADWPNARNVRLTVNNANFDPEVEVFTGDFIYFTTEVAHDDDASTSTDESQVDFVANPNTKYHIQIDGWGGAQGSFVVSIGTPDSYQYCTYFFISCLAWRYAPNTFPGFDLAGAGGGNSLDNTQASGEAGEPGDPVSYPSDASLWYSWTPSESGTARIFTTDIDTTVGVFAGDSVAALTPLAMNDNYNGTPQSLVDVPVTSGQTYRIQLDGGGVNTRGLFDMWFATNPPPNDLFADAATIGGATGTVNGTTDRALSEPGDPNGFYWTPTMNVPLPDVWYTFIAPRNGTVGFEAGNAVINAYEGASITSLTLVGPDPTDQSAATTFATTAGTEYRISVSGGNPFTLRWGYSLCDGRVATITSSGTITGTSGDDVIAGSGGADAITGNGGNDLICAGGGDDVITTGNGNDRVLGGPGDDTLNDGGGTDYLYGGAGRDTILATVLADGSDLYDGGTGFDAVSYQYRNTAVSVTLDAVGNDGGSGENDNVLAERLIGGSSNDTLTGGSANETLEGRGGNDTIDGQGGNDTIKGGAGNDLETGGTGNDHLYGNAGADSMNTQDGVSGNDTAVGGNGADVAQSDPGDTITL
jgi:Ca2+-binding RTX toxin-like protein